MDVLVAQKENHTFEPGRYLTRIEGREYLEVKWRLLWLRIEHPEAVIFTEMVKHEDGLALFKARVTIPGGGEATGWGSETIHDFGDYIEAAETKALGRALAALGYGTQFCQDFDFSANARTAQPQVVDSPVNLPFKLNDQQHLPVDEHQVPFIFNDQDIGPASSPRNLTEKQLKAIYTIGKVACHLDENAVNARCQELYGCLPEQLSKRDASRFIDILKQQDAA